VWIGEWQRIKWLALRSVSMSFCEAAADVKIAISDALADRQQYLRKRCGSPLAR